jgi:hypothetical protein
LPIEQSPEVEDDPAERDSTEQPAYRAECDAEPQLRADSSNPAERRQEDADHAAVQKSDPIIAAVKINVRIEMFEKIAQKEGQEQESEPYSGNDQKYSENTETEDEDEHKAGLLFI